MIMSVKFYCPECQKPLEVDDSDILQQVICYYCHRRITVPETSEKELEGLQSSATQPEQYQETSKRSTNSIIGVTAGCITIALFIVFVILVMSKIMPTIQQESYRQLSVPEQHKVLVDEFYKWNMLPALNLMAIAIVLVPVIGSICSLIGLIKEKAKSAALIGLVINGGIVVFVAYSFLRFVIPKISN
jgi:hypothetical protein